MLAWDNVVVMSSGASSVHITQGLPEGGTLGTAAYVLLPDSLVKELLSLGHGISLNPDIPTIWHGHRWSGLGKPKHELVCRLMQDIASNSTLPGPSALESWPDLEASALKAIQLLAQDRLVAILHADDPVLLSSSVGDLNDICDTLFNWAARHRACFHPGCTYLLYMSPSV